MRDGGSNRKTWQLGGVTDPDDLIPLIHDLI